MRIRQFAAAFVVAAGMCGSATAQVVAVATNPQGSLGYSTGIAVAKVATANSDITVRAQPMGGSTTYVPMINRGEIAFGFSNALESLYAYTGEGTFEGKKNPNLRLVGSMFPLRSGLTVANASGLKSIKDLQEYKGRRITSEYTSLSIIENFIKGALANAGVGYDDFRRVPVSDFSKGIEALGEGKVDITWISLGSGAGRKVDTQLRDGGGFRYLDMDTSPEAVDRFKKWMPAAEIVLESNTKMPGIHEPTHIVELDYLMLTYENMDPEVVYQVTKALVRNHEQLGKSMGAFNRQDPKKMATRTVAPYHPGAVKAYNELGIPVATK